MKKQIQCFDRIKTEYYNSSNIRGVISTEIIYVICYSNKDVLTVTEIVKDNGTGGNTLLPTCQKCIKYGAPIN